MDHAKFNTASPEKTYEAAEIVVLSGPEAVRKRPAMYIGSTGPSGLRWMLLDLVDLAVEGASKGTGRSVAVELHKDGSATVRDDGPGFAIEGGAGAPPLEAAMILIHPCSAPYRIGLPILNALSSSVEVRVRRSGFLWRQGFARGETMGPIERLGPTRESGTAFTFRPDPEIFAGATFEADPIASRLGDLAALNPELRFEFRDERSGRAEAWERRGGLADLVRDLNRGRETLHEPIAFKGRCGGVELAFGFQYHSGTATDLREFANQVRMVEDESRTLRARKQGGLTLVERSTPIAGFLRAIRRAIGEPSRPNRDDPRRSDFLEGLTAAISVRMDEALFMGACRTRLDNPEVAPLAFSIAFLRLFAHFEENPEAARSIKEKVAAGS